MAESLEIIAQAALPATTLTDVYTVPAATQIASSTITICNRSATPTTFRLAFAPDGDPNDDAHYVAYDAPLAANEVWGFTIGVTLNDGDVIRAYAGAATVTVNVFGAVVTP